MSNVNVLKDVIAVNLLFSIWTGRKTLSDGDLSINGETPPKEVISLGSKHTTDPKALKIFHTLKRRAERLCKTVGIQFMGGYAIPSAKADYIASKLHDILGQFEQEKAAYLLKHSRTQQEWINKYPQYKEVLTKALTDASDVENRISATFSMFKMQSVESEISCDTGISKQVSALSGTLDKDVLKEANLLLESLNGALKPCQTNVRGMIKLREKVEGLAFLNGRFNTLVNEMKRVEAQLPVAGNLSVNDQHTLSGLLYRMCEPTRLAELMSQIIAQPQNEQEQVLTIEPETSEQVISENDLAFGEDDYSFGDNSAATTAEPEARNMYF
ncbi:DUF3150 domain-containing protein [Psychromonas aquimarina]|uniref:DUF3150 domain-containing protein n=1 Tax=Psychromonas aquimarina TaxID=444919 RepID=UPI0003F8F5CF|nr:DUF3150 domain-containing protein [Psychromonas aquimarina]